MNSIIRHISIGPAAMAITIGLGLVMTKLIHVPYTALADKTEQLSFIVNPVVTPPPDIAPRDLKPAKRVETPPPPPVLETRINSSVGAPIKEPILIPPWDVLSKKIEPIKMSIDLSLLPLNRPAPIMPPRAQRSGHCDVMFDVNANGNTYNIRTVNCSQSLFSSASVKAAGKWQYRAQIIDGKSVPRTGIKTTISFNLLDARGQLIPE